MSTLTRIKPNSPGLRLPRAMSAMLLLLLLWGICAAHPARAQESVSEDQVKAAFLYNFARFVEWPASAFATEATPITLRVAGNDAFVNTLATLLKEKKAHGRPFVVERMTSVSEASGAHIVFIAKEEARKSSSIVAAVRKQPTLLIGETDDFLETGGIIYLLKDDKQLRFDINLAAAAENKLTISSHLLRLARKTKKAEGSK